MKRDDEFVLEVLEMQNHYEKKINDLKVKLEETEKKNRDIENELENFKEIANELTFSLDSAIKHIQKSNLIISTVPYQELKNMFISDGQLEYFRLRSNNEELPYQKC